CILFHDAREGRSEILKLGRKGTGLPARVIPIECFHVASVGIDMLLGALAYGASQVAILSTGKVADGYVEASKRQMGCAQTIVNALGFDGVHFSLFDNAEELWAMQPAASVDKPATFNFSPEKRTTLDFAIDHLASHAPQKKELIPLSAGAPFGALAVNKQTCTLCKACVGACPASALIDATETPALRFIERKCVHGGLC